jgi:hypothetical protein
MRLYRVFHHLPNARITASAGALYVPSQGAGRLDNPEVYKVLYLGDSPAGVVAEVFGRRYQWEPGMFRGLPMLPGSAHALATYEVPDQYAICDLDDPHQLIEVELRPSRVITRDYEVTQAWALDLYRRGRWSGVRWWSYYDSRWMSIGLWDLTSIQCVETAPLTLEHPAVLEASSVLGRVIGTTTLKKRKTKLN